MVVFNEVVHRVVMHRVVDLLVIVTIVVGTDTKRLTALKDNVSKDRMDLILDLILQKAFSLQMFWIRMVILVVRTFNLKCKR